MQNDENLHKEFVRLGNDRRKLTNELLALLPEINERGIYKKYAVSIVEYAGKFGGLSKGVIFKRLRLEKYLHDKPSLREAIKTEGIHKVAMVASLATPENEEVLVDKIKNMSKLAIQELSKEIRSKTNGNKGNIFCETVSGCKAVPQRINIELDEDMSFLFLKLKKKIGKNLSNKDVMKKILEIADQRVIPQKFTSQISSSKASPKKLKVVPGDRSQQIKLKYKIDINDYILQPPPTRYIPSKIKNQIISKTNGKCSYPNCNKPAEIFHHTDRFAESHSHDSLKPLCKIHHEFAHNGLIQNEKAKAEEWCLDLSTTEISEIDNSYRFYRSQ